MCFSFSVVLESLFVLCVKKRKEFSLMNEKTLKKSAHFISILLNIGFFNFVILSALLFIGIKVIVGVQLFSPEMMRYAW